MKILQNKPDWMTDSSWRALRTFVQNVVGSIVAVLIIALTNYANVGQFDWRFLWLQGIVLGIATALAKLMNKPDDSTTE